ncbi:MAG: VOC family protein [Spirochaetia bacterium]|jgi:lactoylglutathione lyase|nr:VOC family protein [Spirochaetia bacterium]
MKFCWTTITVSDMDKSLAFYQDIIGLKLIRRLKPNEDMEIAFLGEGETQVELIFNEKSKEINFGKDISLGFIVESTSQFSEYLNSKGIMIHSGPFQPNPFIRFIYVQDPDGLKIQFVENIAQ